MSRERGAAEAGLAMVLKDFVYNEQSSFRSLRWLCETITSLWKQPTQGCRLMLGLEEGKA